MVTPEGRSDAVMPEELARKLTLLENIIVSVLSRTFRNRYAQTAQDGQGSRGPVLDAGWTCYYVLLHTVLGKRHGQSGRPGIEARVAGRLVGCRVPVRWEGQGHGVTGTVYAAQDARV